MQGSRQSINTYQASFDEAVANAIPLRIIIVYFLIADDSLFEA